MQELLQIADPNATNQERVVRQAHPTFSRYLRGRPFGSLSELAQEARRVQADILAVRRYHLPPAPTDTLEPRCAWHGPVPRGYRRGKAAMAAASGEPSGNPWELTDDALEPGSRLYTFSTWAPPSSIVALPLSAAKQTNERVPDTPSTVCVPTAYRVGTATSTAAPFISLTVAGKEFAALLDSGASASLIGDEVLRHLQQKSVRDAGVQCSVTLDFQPRIAPGGLSQLGHNRSPSSVHLSGGGQSHGGQAGCSRTPFPRRPPPSRSRHSLL
ncbi:hypothetical protein HPB47_018257 [Ixodes persulcatus]|uniref:Uncharacterized protein n=1 Tax=Ixodes persulcatus TaxID=34615 RepID=A0AC60QPQ1_IXOPE|nr:hypothetical protein HPB47_018257 [Ixodes persulcatus]